MKYSSKRKINILYIIDQFHGIGGTENHLAQLSTNLDMAKFNCFIVVFDFVENHLADKIRDAGIKLIHISVGKYYNFNAIKKASTLFKVIRSNAIDIVQTYHFKSDFYGTIIARLAGAKYIISSKRDTGDLKKSRHFFLLKLVKRIPCKFIVVSDAVGEIVIKKEGVRHDKLVTIYNGVDLNKFQPPSPEHVTEAKRELGFSHDDFVVGMVAWFRPEKNYETFFAAIKEVLPKIEKIKIVAVGGDEDDLQLNYFKAYVKLAGFADLVVFTGQVTDVRPYLRTFDVACLVPSGNEGFSNSIIEKMAMGLPMIVTNVGGNSEAVIDGYNGFIIPPNNIEILAEKILYIAEHPSERKKMGLRSVQRVHEKFTLKGMITAHENLYRSLLDH